MTVDSPQYPPPPPPPGVPGAPVKKGLGVLGWVAIGCGVLLVLSLGTCVALTMVAKKKFGDYAEKFEQNPAKAAAELAVKFNPEVELVSSDEETMTVRNKKTGEEITVNFEDAKEGKFTFKTDKGEATINADADAAGQGGTLTVTGPGGQTATYGSGTSASDVPSWVPIYPGADVMGNYSANTPEGKAGAVTVTTGDTLAEVMDFYEERLKEGGFEVQKMTLSGTSNGGTVTGNTSDQKRAVSAVLSTADGKTQAMVSFSEQNK